MKYAARIDGTSRWKLLFPYVGDHGSPSIFHGPCSAPPVGGADTPKIAFAAKSFSSNNLTIDEHVQFTIDKIVANPLFTLAEADRELVHAGGKLNSLANSQPAVRNGNNSCSLANQPPEKSVRFAVE